LAPDRNSGTIGISHSRPSEPDSRLNMPRSDHFQALVTKQPDNELFRFSLAQALVAENRGAEALAHYEFCVAKKSDWMMARILLGKLLLQLGRRPAAKPLLEDALRLAVDQHHEDPERELRALLADLSDITT
jgi:predicted Zn-dependent protease